MDGWSPRLLGLAVAFLFTFELAPARATPNPGSQAAQSDRLLLVLSVATDEEGQRREQRFVEELELALEGVPVRVVPPRTSDFSDLSLGQQIAEVRPLIEQHSAVAAAWVIELAPDLLLLHMVAVSSGRALARLVEMPPAPGIEADLAMAARELLGTAFLFHELPEEEGPVLRVVESVRREATPEQSVIDVPADAEERDVDLVLLGAAELGGGVYGQSGPSLHAGGALGLDLGVLGALRGRLLTAAWGGYLDRAEEAGVRGWGVAAGLGLAVLFDRGPVSLGPAFELRVLWANVIADLDGNQEQRFESFRYEIAALFELRWWIGDRVGIFFAAGIGATPEREEFIRESTGSVVLTTPYLEWTGKLGLAVPL